MLKKKTNNYLGSKLGLLFDKTVSGRILLFVSKLKRHLLFVSKLKRQIGASAFKVRKNELALPVPCRLLQLLHVPFWQFTLSCVLLITGGVLYADPSSAGELGLGSGAVSAPNSLILEDTVVALEPPVVLVQEGSSMEPATPAPLLQGADQVEVASESPEMGPSRWHFWLGVAMFLGTVALFVWLATSASGGGGGTGDIDPIPLVEGSVGGQRLSHMEPRPAATAVRPSSGVILRDRVLERANTPVLLPGHPPRIRYDQLGLPALTLPPLPNHPLRDVLHAELGRGFSRNLGLVNEQLGLRAQFTALSMLLDWVIVQRDTLRTVENYHFALTSVFRQMLRDEISEVVAPEDFLRVFDNIAGQLHPRIIATLNPQMARIHEQLAREQLTAEAIAGFWEDLIQRYPYLAADRVLFNRHLSNLLWFEAGLDMRERIDYAHFMRLVQQEQGLLSVASNSALQALLLASDR